MPTASTASREEMYEVYEERKAERRSTYKYSEETVHGKKLEIHYLHRQMTHVWVDNTSYLVMDISTRWRKAWKIGVAKPPNYVGSLPGEFYNREHAMNFLRATMDPNFQY
jgi:HD superfamily phosphohydrolase